MYNEKTSHTLYKLCAENDIFAEAVGQMESHHQFIISQITHEIRNPLTLINSTLQLIESQYPVIRDSSLWEQLTEDIGDLILLLQDITTYNHSRNIQLDYCNVYQMLQHLVKNFEIHTSKDNIHLELIASKTIIHKLERFPCDKIKLKQAFTNILKNAIEALNSQGDILVQIKEESNHLSFENSLDYILFSFKNNGEPINFDDKDTIFEPFVTHKPGGTGLGLAITKQIVHAHNGFIECQFDETWTEFKILLPLS